MKSMQALFFTSLLYITLTGCTTNNHPRQSKIRFETSTHHIVTGDIFPETVISIPNTTEFLAGSFYDGKVYKVNAQGNHSVFINDHRIITAMGIRIDAPSDRIYVLGSDLGASIRSTIETTKHKVYLGIYSLTDGSPIHFIDIASTRPDDELHFANDLTLDTEGNVYITDSLAPLIYKVDSSGTPSVFLDAPDKLKGAGFNLNGIVYHPDGYLLIAKKNEGLLLKVPVNNPDAMTTVNIDQSFQGADGLVLVNNNELILIANRMPGHTLDSAFALSTNNNWNSATVTDTYQIENDAYPTTGFIQNKKIYVVHSRLNRFMDPTQTKPLGHQAVFEQVGTLKD